MQAKSSPYKAFAERLHRAFDGKIEAGRSRTTAVATRFTVSRETSRLWLTGAAMPELARLIDIAEFCRVSLDWLATGQDPRPSFVRDDPASAYAISLTADERVVVDAMRGMRPDRRRGLVSLLAP